jgi:hypothetical protein
MFTLFVVGGAVDVLTGSPGSLRFVLGFLWGLGPFFSITSWVRFAAANFLFPGLRLIECCDSFLLATN